MLDNSYNFVMFGQHLLQDLTFRKMSETLWVELRQFFNIFIISSLLEFFTNFKFFFNFYNFWQLSQLLSILITFNNIYNI